MNEPQFNSYVFSGQKHFGLNRFIIMHNGQPMFISAYNYFMINLLRQGEL